MPLIGQGTLATLLSKLSGLTCIEQGAETFQLPESRGNQDAATTLQKILHIEYCHAGETVYAMLLWAHGPEEEHSLQRWNHTKTELQLMLAFLDVHPCPSFLLILRHQG